MEMDRYSEKNYGNLSTSERVCMVKATDDSDTTDSTLTQFIWTILEAFSDAGPDQNIKSNELAQLDGSSSSDPDASVLNYS